MSRTVAPLLSGTVEAPLLTEAGDPLLTEADDPLLTDTATVQPARTVVTSELH